jgi:putative inorganic carbon (HCO3(-)) transporter
MHKNTKLLWLLVIVIIWLPWPLGNNRMLFWTLTELVVALMSLIWLWQYFLGKAQLTPSFITAKPVLVMWVAWILYIALQLLPLPMGVISILSPQAYSIHSLINAEWATLSVAPYLTALSLFKSICFFQLFALVLLLAPHKKQLNTIIYALIISGLVQALYGILMMVNNLEGVLFSEFFLENSGNHTSYVSGGFTSRNHMANYMAMCVAMGLGLLISQMRDSTTKNFKAHVLSLIEWLLSPKAFVRFSILLMSAALIMTRSRMGNAAFFTSLLIASVIALICFLKGKHSPRKAVILIGSLIVLDILIMGTVVGLDKVVERIENTSTETEMRDESNTDALDYWQDYPLLGSGLGTFEVPFQQYKTPDLKEYHRKYAHNDYLQFATEIGIVGILLLISIVILTLFRAIRTLYSTKDPLRRGISFSVVMIVIIMIVHSTVEFNLQIFANAATLVIILALAWVTVQRKNGSRRVKSWPQSPGLPAKIFGLGASTMLIVGMQVQGLAWASTHTLTRLNDLSLYQSMEDSELWEGANQRQLLATRLTPYNTEALQMMDVLNSSPHNRSLLDIDAAEAKDRNVSVSINYLLKALESNPGESRLWGHIALRKQQIRQYDELFFAALKNAATLAPKDWPEQVKIVNIGLKGWKDLSQTRARPLIEKAIQQIYKMDPKTTRYIVDSMEVTDIALPWESPLGSINAT